MEFFKVRCDVTPFNQFVKIAAVLNFLKLSNTGCLPLYSVELQ